MIKNFNTKKLKQLRGSWAKPIDKFRNFDLISFYHQNKLKDLPNGEIVDESTWNDLNFDDIFTILDRNNSPIGQQYLYHILHIYEKKHEILSRRIELAEYFKNNADIREQIQLNLISLDTHKTYFISPLVFGALPKRPKYYPLFWVLSYISWISLLLIFLNGHFFFLALGSFFVNLVVNHIYSKNIHDYFEGFSAINSLFNAILKINRIENIDLPELHFLNTKKKIIKRIKKKIGSFVIDFAGANEVMVGIIEYLNIYFLYDLKKYSNSVGLLIKHQKDIQQVFETIGQIDTAISIASYLTYLQKYSKPEFIEQKSINFNNVYHPLIVDAVPNTLNNFNKSLLITGSNMAGKTTFIKTVGVNIILAQTINICLADSAKIPRLNVISAIRREENLEDEKSYFFVEVECLKGFIDIADKKSNYLFLIDEIFRGTNTIERLSASTAVLEELSNNNIVYVTTHDIELQELLISKFDMYHFSECVNDNKYYFDYKLQNGPTSSGNAIKLLELKNYPREIIDRANNIKERLLSSGNNNI